MKLRAGKVSIGDSFTKTAGFSRTVYVVTSLVEAQGAPPHVRLAADGEAGAMLISISALLDSRLWSRVSTERD